MKAFAVLVFILVGCATPYGPKGWKGGYSEMDAGNGVVAVTFEGNGYTSSSDVATYALKRSSEYCQEQGKPGYEIINWAGDHSEYQTADNTHCQSNGQLNGNYYSGNTNCRTTPGMKFNKHTATLYVRCGGKAAH